MSTVFAPLNAPSVDGKTEKFKPYMVTPTATVLATLNVYVPAPPVPVPKAVMIVPRVTPTPLMV